MSGGSYNYLHRQLDIGQLSMSDLENMAARLDQLAPGSAAATDTRALLDTLRGIEGNLGEVWRAVEWLDSHDEDEDQTQESIAAYERRPEAAAR